MRPISTTHDQDAEPDRVEAQMHDEGKNTGTVSKIMESPPSPCRRIT